MVELLIHKKLRLLHKDADKNLKIKSLSESPFGFAAHVNSIIVAGPEFAECSKTYPIFFAKGEEGITRPLALLGLENEKNLFVNEEGRWTPYCYIPAFFRRYPFIFQQDENNSLNLCIDEAYGGFNEEEGQALFDEDGTYSEYLIDLLRFMNDYEKSIHITEQFANQLDEAGLLDPVELNVTNPDNPDDSHKIGGLFQVNVERLQKMDDLQVIEEYRQGSLLWIHHHLNSLSNIQHLSNRFNNRKKETMVSE